MGATAVVGVTLKFRTAHAFDALSTPMDKILRSPLSMIYIYHLEINSGVAGLLSNRGSYLCSVHSTALVSPFFLILSQSLEPSESEDSKWSARDTEVHCLH